MRKTRLWSILLVFAMLLTLLPVTALADDTVWDGTAVDTSWYDEHTSDSEFTITTAAELAGLAQLVNAGNDFSGKTIRLGADIDLAGHDWTPIGTSGKPFIGTFDGQKSETENYTISNLTVTRAFDNTASNNYVGLFGLTNSPAVIKNLTIENVDLQGSLYVGAAVGYGFTGTVSNVTVQGNIAIDAWWYAGGLIGNGYVSISNCHVNAADGSYIKGNDGSYIGGIIGFRGEGVATLTGCTVKNVAISGYDRLGGISGIAHYGSYITDCHVEDVTITADGADCKTIGLIAGANLAGTTAQVRILDCTAVNTTASVDGTEITDFVSMYTHDGNSVTQSTIVGSEVTFDENGNVTGGLFTQITDDIITASGLSKQENEDGTIELIPSTGSEAAVNHTYYATFADAVAAAMDGDTITLMSDITLTSTVEFTKEAKIKLDLNDHSITGENVRALWVKNGTLALTGTGTITTVAAETDAINPESSVIRVGDNDGDVRAVALTIGENVTISAPATYGVSAFGSATNETVTVYGTINATGTRAALAGSGTDTSTGTILNIEEGAKLTAENYYAIYHPQNGTLNVNGGEITGVGGIQMCAGMLNITGEPVITATNAHDPGTVDGSDGAVLDGAAVSLVNRSYPGGAPDAKIDSGTFIAQEGVNALQVYTWSNETESDWEDAPTGFILGGSFSNSMDEAYLSENLKAELKSASNTDAPYSYYTSLEDALAAAQPGDEVRAIHVAGTTTYQLTLDYNDGTTEKTVYTVESGTKITLPAPTWEGFEFQGWSDGTTTYKANTEYEVTKEATLTAQWSKIFYVTVQETTGGAVTASPTSGVEKTVVTLTVTPDEDYELKTLVVTDANDKEVKTEDAGEGKYSFEMPASDVTVEATFAKVEEPEEPCDGGENCPAHDYDDVNKKAWYHEYVDYVLENGYMVGISTDPATFAPDSTLTRAQAIQTLYQMEGEPEVEFQAYYGDVTAEKWFAAAVTWGTENGIVQGRDTKEFDPDGKITREELVTIIYRYVKEYKQLPVETDAEIPDTYTDTGKIGFFAEDAFAWAIDREIVNGMTETTLVPQGQATRAQMAKIITVLCESYPEIP